MTKMTHDPKQLIAVVGMAARFPGAPDVESFWQLLMDRGDAIRPVPRERWDADAQLDPEKSIQAVGGFLDGVADFDPIFFGISPREAVDMDPQQRLMLEACWQAVEDAGARPDALKGSPTGVYVGASWHDYEILRKDHGAAATQHSAVGNALDVIAARVSYVLKLTGPSMTVETGCSSSLVALHLAGQALRTGEIDGALVGGVNLILAPDVSIGLTHFGGLSPEGRCKAFAATADGFVRGEGVAAIYLKTLDRALRDGDRIHGVIVGTAVNNDGGGESLVTPNPTGQESLLRRAYARAGIPLDRLAYVEAHGTGTLRGDPIEAKAIGAVLGQPRGAEDGGLAIGSVKTNIGHLEAAAGIAGLIKALLVVEHRTVPPSLHLDQLNPEIPFTELNLRVVRDPLPLSESGSVYVGVNSFGWGGTNAHVILTNAPQPAEPTAEPATRPATGPVPDSGLPALVPLSAHTEQTLAHSAGDLADALAAIDASPTALAGALAWRRSPLPYRAAFVADRADRAGDPLREQLRRFAANPADEALDGATGRARPRGRTAFVFPGQGAQWADMGRELYAHSPRFAATIRRCAEALAPFIDWNLLEVISGAAGDEWLGRIDMLQPTCWAMSVGLAELWRAAGITPDVVVGHSQGEIAAATVAGILSYSDGARVVACRSKIIRRVTGRGLMLAVDLGVREAREMLAGFEDSVALAVNNGPTSSVLSGDSEAVLTLKELLDAEDVFCRLVKVDYASHSPQMDLLTEDLLDVLAPVRPRAGGTALMSTVRVASLAGPEMDARYWSDNLRQPVLFADAMGVLLDADVTHVIEVSPHPVLTPAVEQLAAQRPEPPAVLSTLRRDAGAPRDMTLALARAYVAGLEPFGGLPRNSTVALPGYPWQRTRYWVGQGKRRPTVQGGLEPALAPAPAEDGSWQGSIELTTDGYPWLADHQVHDATVLPATAMLTLAVNTARARTGTMPRTMSDVRFHANLTLGEEPVPATTWWREDVTEGGSFTLLSLPAGGTAWTTHATARLEQFLSPDATTSVEFPESLLAEPADGTEPAPVEAFYAGCAARGLNYGPAFRCVEQLHIDGGAALGLVRLTEQTRAGARPHGLHPALWDGALQVSLALCEGPETVVPTAIRRIHLLHDPDEPVLSLWSHAMPRAVGEFDVHLFDEAKRPLMTIEGLRLERLGTTESADTDRLHRLQFQGLPRDAGPGVGGSWLVCGEPADGAGELAGALAAGGANVTTAAAMEILDEPAGVVFMAPRASAGLAAQRAGLLALTTIVRQCVAKPTPPRIVVVTADAQAVLADDLADPGAALYWGYGRVLRREHGELSAMLMDTAPRDPEWATACAAELLSSGDEDQLVLRGQRRFVGRLTRGKSTMDPVRPATDWRTPAQPFRLGATRPGFWDGLAYLPLSRRTPAAGEVEIEVTASALNFIDVMKAMGTYPDGSAGASLLGGECAGRVVATGPGVSSPAVGDRVVACQFGSFASHVTVRADHTRPIPAGLDDAAAAALPLVGTTAWHGFKDLAQLEPGETVLIHSAAGGLGLAAIQVARALGAEVIATAGTEDKRAYLRELGVRQVFDSRSLRWAEQVRAATGGRGVDVVLNSLTGAAIPLGLAALAEHGRFIEVGKKDIYAGRNISLTEFRKSLSISAVDIAGLMARRPERFARLFAEMWELVGAGKLGALPVIRHTFADAGEALRAMSHGSHIGKFVLVDPGTVGSVTPEPMPEGRFRADATYLVTGGLGALGLSLAEFLADRGAGAVALLSRSAPSAAVAQRVDALRARGVRVVTSAVDVADADALGRALDEFRVRLPPLRGVFHAAGLLDDATILTLTPDQVERVITPKIDGARHLHEATMTDPLDLFVMFSSAAALLGNAGQAAYAAGNAFLDALATRRRTQGLPGLSVQWGPFASVGLAAQDANRGDRLAERGMGGFGTDQAWQALVQLLATDEPVFGYVPLNLRQWFDAYPDAAAQPSWQVLRETALSGGAPGAGSTEFLTRLRATPGDAWQGQVETKVRELAGRVLRLDSTTIDGKTPFKALGLDSLMGLELRNRLEAAFDLKLSPTLLWTYGSSHALAEVLCERLTG